MRPYIAFDSWGFREITWEAAMGDEVTSNDMKFGSSSSPSRTSTARRNSTETRWARHEFASGDDLRVIQFTPPGSGCSIIFGKNVTAAAPGSAQGLYLIVSDIAAARDELRGRGIEVSEVFRSDGVYAGTDEPYLFGRRRTGGPDPGRGSYRSFASFRDPDGNGWLFQEITTRLAGRIDSGVTSFASANDLAEAFRRAEGGYSWPGSPGGTNWRVAPRTWSWASGPELPRDYRDHHRHQPAGPITTSRLAGAGMKVAVIERNAFGGTCINTGCIPTKTMVASAYAARMAARAAEYGVDVGSVRVDMKRVMARKEAVSKESRTGLEDWLRSMENCTVYRGHARFESAQEVTSGGAPAR
jgi:hypothetical protein